MDTVTVHQMHVDIFFVRSKSRLTVDCPGSRFGVTYNFLDYVACNFDVFFVAQFTGECYNQLPENYSVSSFEFVGSFKKLSAVFGP